MLFILFTRLKIIVLAAPADGMVAVKQPLADSFIELLLALPSSQWRTDESRALHHPVTGRSA